MIQGALQGIYVVQEGGNGDTLSEYLHNSFLALLTAFCRQWRFSSGISQADTLKGVGGAVCTLWDCGNSDRYDKEDDRAEDYQDTSQRLHQVSKHAVCGSCCME